MFPLELMFGFLEKSATILSKLFINCGGIKFTSPLKIVTEPTIKFIRNIFTELLHLPKIFASILILVTAMLLLFLALYYIVKLMKSLVSNKTETVLINIIGRKGIIGIFVGLAFTAMVQSSSITTSLLIPLISAEILTIELAFPITMGANIGTTTTAMLASFATGNSAAITIAFVHFLFNLIGVSCIYPIKIFRKIPIYFARQLGELAFKKRWYAFAYVLGFFFLLPGIFVILLKILK
ncbi:MAG: hypothetical protein DRP78_00540 [Candidatus Omnitrophota bacterium]|nr:MAG: hypothetical protein DRP78_00540 [Candidatus Omnitrophota bacterium]